VGVTADLSWTHQFFWCQKKGSTFVCRYQIKNANFWLPRSFIWTDASDKTTLRAYLDALTHKDKKITVLWEEKGLAVEHVYEPEPECGVIRVDPLKLMAVLRGEYVLEIPMTGRILGVEEKHLNHYMPQEVQAALVADSGLIHDAYVRRLQQLVNAGKPVICLTKEQANSPKMKELGIEIWNPATNLNGDTKFTDMAPKEIVEGMATDQEQELDRVQYEMHLEITYACQNYFTRRLFLLDGTPFWSASSYDRHKWSVFFSLTDIYDSVFSAECAK